MIGIRIFCMLIEAIGKETEYASGSFTSLVMTHEGLYTL